MKAIKRVQLVEVDYKTDQVYLKVEDFSRPMAKVIHINLKIHFLGNVSRRSTGFSHKNDELAPPNTRPETLGRFSQVTNTLLSDYQLFMG